MERNSVDSPGNNGNDRKHLPLPEVAFLCFLIIALAFFILVVAQLRRKDVRSSSSSLFACMISTLLLVLPVRSLGIHSSDATLREESVRPRETYDGNKAPPARELVLDLVPGMIVIAVFLGPMAVFLCLAYRCHERQGSLCWRRVEPKQSGAADSPAIAGTQNQQAKAL